jgi:3'-5' exoribonuclease
MLKIKDFAVGTKVESTLLVKESGILFTRTNKPYLNLMLTDGSDSIKSVDWDWGDKPALNKGIVIDFKAEVSEYMGNKQLKLLSLQPSDSGVELFAPSGDVNLVEYMEHASKLIDEINNEQLKMLVRNVFNDNAKGWKIIPAAKGMHHAFVSGLIKHSVDVARKAKAIAEITPMANVDLVVGGALLHDMGKLWTYVLQGALIEMTDNGQMLEHIMIGAMELNKYRTPENSDVLDLVLHIISSHHGELEYGSPTTPRFMEAVIVNYADGVDAKCQMLIEQNMKTPLGNKMTDKVYALGNRPMFSQLYISSIMDSE